jgi:putative aminopeptidase FrvX
MKSRTTAQILAVALMLSSRLAMGQAPVNATGATMFEDLRTLTETPAVSGYESDLTKVISGRLVGLSPKTDNVGDLIVTIGSGAPHRLIVTSIDEPGFVVSAITPDGYLRVQRLPQFGLSSLWNELYSAQPVSIRTRDGRWANGAVAGLSVHLQPGRQHPPDLGDLDNIYVDVGATSPEQVRAAGIDVLDPLALDRTLYQVGNDKLSANAVQNRFGAAALLQLLRDLDRPKVKGTLTIAFANQQWTGSRGLIRLLDELNPDELLFVGPLLRAPNGQQSAMAKTGSGVLVADGASADVLQALKQAGDQLHVAIETEAAAPLLARSYLPAPKLPARTAHLGIPVAWLTTPAQYIDARDLTGLVRVLEQYVQGEAKEVAIPAANPLPERTAGTRPTATPSDVEVLKRVVETYGVSDHEAMVADTVAQLLPAWAKPTKDKSGNLILHWGPKTKGKGIVVVAHQDEIGFEVKSVMPDGRLELINKGGGTPAFFAGHQVLFHTAAGIRPAVLELPQGWNQPKFQWGDERNFQFIADVGANSAEEATKLGFKVGDWASVPKKYRPMIGTRASARSFDDRVGCAALISATWKLGPDLGNRDVTFVWSTGEELGLLGAAAFAKQQAAEGNPAAFVFAIDTFVSADSPIESKRFGDAIVGHGFVVRAVDNSNIVPHDDVNELVRLVTADHVPVQYGVTGGGNDGSAFVRYGSIDVAMGWPLRYSHSPAEVIDTKDLDALTNATVTVARKWSR